MIHLTRLNGQLFALNPDLLERAEATPDTVVTLVDGTKLVVKESVEDIIERVREHHASVLARALELERPPVEEPSGVPHLTPVSSPRDDEERPANVVPLAREGV